MTENRFDEDIEISLVDLLAYIIRKWKSIIIVMIICGALVGIIMSIRESGQLNNRYSDLTYADLTREMSQSQINNVSQLYRKYRSYEQQIAYNQDYLNKSYLMRLTPEDACILYTEYAIFSDQGNISSSFSRMALGEEEYKAIAAILGDDVEARYVYELLSVSGGDNDEGYVLDIDNSNDLYTGNIGNKYKSILITSIRGADRTECEAINNIVDQALQKHLQELSNAGLDVQMSKVGNQYREIVDTGLASAQQSKMTESTELIAEYQKFIKDNISTLSAEEKDLYDFFAGRDDTVEDHVHWKKYTAIGLAAGMLIMLVIYALRYIFDDVIRTNDEFQMVYGMSVFGNVYLGTKKKGLSGLLNKLADQIAYNRNNTEQYCKPEVLQTRVQQYCEKNNIHSLYIVTDSQNEAIKAFAESVRKYLATFNMKVMTGTPRSEVDALHDFGEAEAAVYVAELNKTSRNSAMDYRKLCDDFNVSLIGAIPVIAE